MRLQNTVFSRICCYARVVEFLRYLLSLGIIDRNQANRASDYYAGLFDVETLLPL